MTTTDYVSSVNLLPTIEFLENVSRTQWTTDTSYAIAFSTAPYRFFSTTNSEWVCLNSESELLGSKFGTASIKTNFNSSRPDSSPALLSFNDLKIPVKSVKNAQSVFLYRNDGQTEEIILNANFSKSGDNQTSAPLLDCFSRECMSWFSSEADYFIGFGSMSSSLSELIVNDDGVIISKSEDILSSLIPESTQSCPYTSIQIINTVSSLTPYVTIQFSTGVEYINTESTPNPNIIFLFSVKNSNSLVSFAGQYTAPQLTELSYSSIETKIYWQNQEVTII